MLSSRYSKYQVGNPVCEAGLVFTRMVKPPTAVTLVRNSVAPSDNPKLDAPPATTKVGTMAEKTVAA